MSSHSHLRPLYRLIALAVAAAATLLLAASTHAPSALAIYGNSDEFGISAFDGEMVAPNGWAESRAGAHPFALTNTITFNHFDGVDRQDRPAVFPHGDVRRISVDLPPGFVGNPSAVPVQCTEDQLALGERFEPPGCPVDSQVGIVEIEGVMLGDEDFQAKLPVYSMVAPPGMPALFGFRVVSTVIHINVRIRPGDYGVTAYLDNTQSTVRVVSSRVTFWGVPADPAHDAVRGNACAFSEIFATKCPSSEPGQAAGFEPVPFLSNPTSCNRGGTEIVTGGRFESWEGRTAAATFFNHDPAGNPVANTECDRVPFDATLDLQPSSGAADSPAAIEANLSVAQNENPAGRTAAHVKDVEVTLPEGMTVNPSSANGLGACSLAEIGLGTNAPPRCPDSSKLGTVEVATPLLDEPLPGSIYLARQNENPFGSLLALYVVVSSPRYGVTIKLAGEVTPDPRSGRLTARFENNPQLPFSRLSMRFKDGPRAALVNPATCGPKTVITKLTPWSAAGPNNPAPAEVVTSTSSFEVSSGPGGGPCPSAADFRPAFAAGTVAPLAGAATPLVINASRPDGSQPLAGIDVDLPPGLLGKLKGIPYCPQAALDAAAGRDGRAEQAAPSCPAASRVGKVTVGAGAGSAPYYTEGEVYLAGPYKGAPLSMAVVTPAVAGPFDLGTVVVRAAVMVNPVTAEIDVRSDPIPQILQGIPLKVRSLAIVIDRPDFTRNPTDCSPLAFGGTLLGGSSMATLSSRFQVGGCKGLAFAPQLSLRLRGGTKRAQYPALTAVLQAKPGHANIARTSVALPHSEFLAQEHIRTICTRAQFRADDCPKGSIYGYARAFTPLLDQPLQGPVYLRSSDNQLPDLVAALRGQIEIELVGRIDSFNGGIRATFERVPDAPVSRFVLKMRGGKKGLLSNSRDICRGVHRATVKMDGHNGKAHDFRPALKPNCSKGSRLAERQSGP